MSRKPIFSIPNKALSRRTLLRGAGSIAVALPFLDAMAPRVSRAQTAVPKRLVIVFSANGMIKDQWQPSGGETDFTLSPILASLEPHRDDLLIMRGLNNDASYIYGPNAHDASMSTLLTADAMVVGPSGTGRAGHVLDGTAAGPSIDQEIAKVIGGQTKLSSLELGVQSTTTILEPMPTRMCYRGTPGNAKSIAPEDDPKKVFSRLFMDANTATETLDRLKQHRRSVLDFVRGDFERLQLKVSSADKQKLERHLTTVRDFEQSLDNLSGADGLGCDVPSEEPTANLDPFDCIQDDRPARCFGDFQELGKAQMDMLTLALTCDLTRVVTLQWSTAESTVFHKWLNVAGEHHLMSHDAVGNRNDLIKIQTWYAEQFKYLLDALKGQEDEGGSILDSSVVLWVNELSDGDVHNRRDLGWIIAGKGNGAILTGRSIKVQNVMTNHLFASLLTMFGAPTDSFGAAQFRGTMSGLG
jgi:Protein of unknown function (DUF1552)